MKVSLEWLSEYVKVPEAQEAARRLTMGGLEVEAVTRQAEGLDGVVVAQIVSSEPHPNADKLSVTKVAMGGAEPLQVVCGAKNYRVGDKVPLATVGATLPGGMHIAARPMRGQDSFGMLCSAKELGLAEDASGLMILDPALEVGTPIAKALGRDGVVLEVNVTPNRADALSMLGVARELSALTGAPVSRPKVALAEAQPEASSKVTVRIDDAARCWRYAARVIEGVTVGPSPAWLAARLEASGVRAINNLVDVTNYVLLEYGQPLHAFDFDRVAGGAIVVRTAKAGETLTTLDGKARTLDAEDLLVCDAEKPLVLAGVMGGESSEVTASTTRVLLECATFQPTTVRRSSRRHALTSESSYRFERGTDVSVVPEALDRAAALIAQLAGGTVLAGRVDAYPEVKPSREVTLRAAKVAEVLGVPVPMAECERILSALGFERLGGDDAQTRWRVPMVRVDVSIEEDLIEEVARIRGYEAIPEALPRGLKELSPERPEALTERRIRAALAGQGVDEVVQYSFVAPAELAALGAGEGAWALTNPLSVEQSVMRTTLYASLVPAIARSARHQAAGLRFYEWARTYHPQAGGGEGATPVALERLEVAGALWGLRGGTRKWTEKDAPVDFYDARAAVEAVCEALHVEAVTFEAVESPWYHPRASAVVRAGGRPLGTLGELHPRAQRKLDAPTGIFLFQLDVEALVAAARLVPQAKALSRFPAMLRDLAVVVPQAMPAAQVRDVILEVGQPLVEDAQVFDVYAGAQVGEGRKNLAFALRYRSPERTLTDTEVSEAHARIVSEVTSRLGGLLRT